MIPPKILVPPPGARMGSRGPWGPKAMWYEAFLTSRLNVFQSCFCNSSSALNVSLRSASVSVFQLASICAVSPVTPGATHICERNGQRGRRRRYHGREGTRGRQHAAERAEGEHGGSRERIPNSRETCSALSACSNYLASYGSTFTQALSAPVRSSRNTAQSISSTYTDPN